jgi:glycosyltransferase involved in cell wall biosynthesis
MSSRTAVHLFDSPITTESRFLKLSGTLLDSGCVDQVEVLGLWRPGLSEVEQLDARRRVRRLRLVQLSPHADRLRRALPPLGKLLTLGGLLQRQAHALWHMLRTRPAVVLAHNPELLPVAIIGAALTGARAFYVPHELEAERAGVRHPGIVRWIERRFASKADLVVVVSPRIAEWYAQTYPGVQPLTLRNIPRNPRRGQALADRVSLRERFEVPDDALLFIYQGLIDTYRDVPALLDCFERDARHHIVFMGFGDGVSAVQATAERCPRVHYLPPVPMDRIIAHSAGADVGLLLAPEPSSLSYRLTTANKLFEYAIAEVPIILSSNFSYMAELVVEHRLGWVIPPTAAALADRIRGLDRATVATAAAAFADYSRTVDWDAEADAFRQRVRQLLPSTDAAGAN